jgi:hypothetical protein
MNTSSINKNSLIATIVFHVIVVLLLLFLALRVPLPLPGEKGILVNFGTTEEGVGVTEPNQQQQQVPVQQEKSEESNLTQDFEEAPVIQHKDNKKPKKEEQKTNKLRKQRSNARLIRMPCFPEIKTPIARAKARVPAWAIKAILKAIPMHLAIRAAPMEVETRTALEDVA